MSVSRRQFLAASAAAVAAHRLPAADFADRSAPVTRTGFDPWLEVDRQALARNVATISRLADKRPVIVVAKNNAYGCGIATVGPMLDPHPNVWGFAVVRTEEALGLRRAGVRKPLLLMGPVTDEEAIELARSNIRLAPYLRDDGSRLTRLAARLGRPVKVHLYVDTGMHRMGMPHEQVLAWLDDSTLRRAIAIEGTFTELTEDQDFDREQAGRLRALADAAANKGVNLGLLHAASSDAVAHPTPETFLDAVRTGITVYGGYPTEEMMSRGELTPAYRLKARVIRVDSLAPGEGVSYHRRFTAKEPTTTATLAVGHVDGYPTGAVRGCDALIGGKHCPVIGTVSASHTVVAVDPSLAVKVGDHATLVGPDDPAIHPNAIAKQSDWSEYNMFMHLNSALRRVAVG